MTTPTAAATTYTTGVIGGVEAQCEVRTETERIDVTSDRATRPDRRWTFVDAAGHFHAWTNDGELPTLRSETVQMPCDGSCGGICQGEGYTRIVYHCRICDELVAPGRVDDTGTKSIPGATTFTVAVYDYSPTDLNTPVSVRLAWGTSKELFGIGRVVDGEIRSGGGGRCTILLEYYGVRAVSP